MDLATCESSDENSILPETKEFNLTESEVMVDSEDVTNDKIIEAIAFNGKSLPEEEGINPPLENNKDVDDKAELAEPNNTLNNSESIFAVPNLPTVSKLISKKPNDPTIKESNLPDKDCHDEKSSVIVKPKDENSMSSRKSPAQRLADKSVAVPYKEPSWSGLPKFKYSFQVLKGGAFLENINLDTPYTLIGRSDSCRINMEHPSISRHHCIIQHRPENGETPEEAVGLYVFDLGSTHGTFLNKYRIIPRKYIRIKVGHIVKFGGSTRLYILEGPCDDQEPESDLSVTELQKAADEKKLKLKLQNVGENKTRIREPENDNSSSENGGIDWGMGEDAEEEKDDSDDSDEESHSNPYALPEELHLDDPKKTLRGWFEREGYDLPNYVIEEISAGFFRVKLQLPLPTGSMDSINCSIDHKGKKKDGVIQCALEACRMLDKRKLLRQAKHTSHARKKNNYHENDYYSSEEDDYFDRTGDIQHKRRKRMGESVSKNNSGEVALTYKSIIADYEKVCSELNRLDKLLETAGAKSKSREQSEELDTFMMNLDSLVPDKHKIIEWKLECVKLRKEESRLRELVNISRPTGVEEIKPKDAVTFVTSSKKIVPVTIGRRSSKILLVEVPKTKVPTRPATGVHKLFLEEDVVYKQKLTKVDCNDDSMDLKPVPYYDPKSKPQKRPSSVESSPREYGSLEEKSVGAVSSDKSSLNKRKLSNTDEDEKSEDKPSDCLVKDAADESDEEKSALEERLMSEVKPDDSTRAEAKKLIKGPCILPKDMLKMKKAIEFNTPSLLKKHKNKALKKKIFDEEDTWVPPVDQTGDGRTHLNSRFGY